MRHLLLIAAIALTITPDGCHRGWPSATTIGAELRTAKPAQPTPTIKPRTAFLLPLADDSTATAEVARGPDGQAWLIYATAAGQLSVWQLTPPNITPPPQPPPPPTPPPQPPPSPTLLTIAVIEDPLRTTPADKQTLLGSEWRDLARTKHAFIGIIPYDTIDPATGQAPPKLAPYLKAAAGHKLPWLYIGNAAGEQLHDGVLPANGAAFVALIHKYGGP